MAKKCQNKKTISITIDEKTYNEIQNLKLKNSELNISKLCNDFLNDYAKGKELSDVLKKHDKYIEEKLDKIIHQNVRYHTYMLNHIYRNVVSMKAIFYLILNKFFPKEQAEKIIETVETSTPDNAIREIRSNYSNISDDEITSAFPNLNKNF